MSQSEKVAPAASERTREVRAQTPEEQQAMQFLVAANDIATEMEVWRRRLRQAATPAQRKRIEQEITEASERLCNMFALIELQLTKNVRQEFRDQLNTGLTGIKQKLAEMGTKVMLKKIQAIQGRAEAARSGRGYPIGLAAKLERNYDAVMDNLRLFGGHYVLTEPQQALIDSTREMIANLNEYEEQLGMMRSFDEDEEEAAGEEGGG